MILPSAAAAAAAAKVYPKHSQWVEVSRARTAVWNEGYSIGMPKTYPVSFNQTMVSYGCWFHHAKGSGIFVNLGRSLMLPDKQEYPRRSFPELNPISGCVVDDSDASCNDKCNATL